MGVVATWPFSNVGVAASRAPLVKNFRKRHCFQVNKSIGVGGEESCQMYRYGEGIVLCLLHLPAWVFLFAGGFWYGGGWN